MGLDQRYIPEGVDGPVTEAVLTGFRVLEGLGTAAGLQRNLVRRRQHRRAGVSFHDHPPGRVTPEELQGPIGEESATALRRFRVPTALAVNCMTAPK